MTTNQITQKNDVYKYICNFCHFNSNKNNDYDRHLLTSKHKRLTKTNNLRTNHAQTSSEFICECGKQYKHQSSLCKHKKKCFIENIIEDTKPQQKLSDVSDKDQLIMILIKENTDFKSMLMEQQNMMMKVIENGTTNNNCNNTTNSHNKAFNLNFFLNETCKDAMNITDFIDSIKLQLSDLEKVGEVGYVEGISNIIIKNLNDLDETKRPVHCTDKKRETIYIKDQGQWEKDDNKTILKKSINKIANKNIRLISQFREKYPECRKSESKLSDKYNKMIIEAMGGLGDNNVEKEEKIIRNITKATTINK